MKKLIPLAIIAIASCNYVQAQTPVTTTITGSVKITDSLNVINSIKSSSSISAAGAITATGEVVAKDTMRALKDILVDGNVIIDGKLSAAGDATLSNLKLGGSLVLPSTLSSAVIDPCLHLLVAQPLSTGGVKVTELSPAQANNLQDLVDANPCPTPPVIPFTWQTYGNHVNSNNRWIGTVENFDFNIKTNSILRMNVKNNGTVNLFTTNSNTTGVLVIKNNDLNKDILNVQSNGALNVLTMNSNSTGAFVIKNSDLNKNIFQVQNNGATYIGSQRVTSRPNSLLTVSGEVDCSSLYVLKPVTWQDRVFEPSYNLESLSTIENYVKANKHLPGIKSEKEILEKGYDVNEIDAVLLEKIENLYLYIIQQQKEIDALKANKK